MFSVSPAQFVHIYKEASCQADNKCQRKENIQANNVDDGKKNEQHNKPTAKVPDVLRFQPFKLDGLVYALVDLIDTVAHDKCFTRQRMNG